MEIILFSQPVTGNWLVDIIAWLIKICSSIALGVIVFTLLLKFITLPFDFISRASMRKNSLKMEKMRPELEKLQKQYANDKNLYNQKMAALYKQNGYSMWGACLPTILTLVIFIVAINGFTNYSRYANKVYLYNMVTEYNNVVYSGMQVDDEYIKYNNDYSLTINASSIIANDTDNDGFAIVNKEKYDIIVEYNPGNKDYYEIYTTNSVVKYVSDSTGKFYKVKSEDDHAIEQEFNIYSQLSPFGATASEKNNFWKNSKGQTFGSYCELPENEGKSVEILAEEFIKDIRELKSAESFGSEDKSFLWVKNIWITDSPMKHPIETSWNSFKNSYFDKKDNSAVNVTEDQYQSLIAKLDVEKEQPNGLFILVALTALSSLAMQLITNKSQKAQMELQTVDGQGASTNKMMTWMMPIMMAVFAFMYTAAFSIYIVLSTLFSMLTTIIINAIIDSRFKKQEANENNEVVRGRVYVPPKEENKKKEKKGIFAKKEQPVQADFLTGKISNKGKK